MIKNRVKQHLAEIGMTQKELALKMKITPEALNRTISGNPTLKTLFDIARALETDPKELLPTDEIRGFVEVDGIKYHITCVGDLEKVLKIANT